MENIPGQSSIGTITAAGWENRETNTYEVRGANAVGTICTGIIKAPNDTAAYEAAINAGLTDPHDGKGPWIKLTKETVRINLPPQPTAAAEVEVGQETKPFTLEFIKQEIYELLKAEKSVTEIKKLELEPMMGNRLHLEAQISAKKFFVSTEINLTVVLVNRLNTIGAISEGYSVTATKFKDQVEQIFEEKIASIGEMIKGYIEENEGREVSKIQILTDGLEVTFAAPETKAIGVPTIKIPPPLARAPMPRLAPEIKVEKKNPELEQVEKQAVELEELLRFIDAEITQKEREIAERIDYKDEDGVDYRREEIKSLKEEPIKYFVRYRDYDQKQLNSVNQKGGGEADKVRLQKLYSDKVRAWQKAIDRLEALEKEQE